MDQEHNLFSKYSLERTVGRVMKKSVAVIAVLLMIAAGGILGIRTISGSSDKTTLHVLAAASLKDAMEELKQQYESNHQSINLEINYASSGKLQRQIEQGVQADLFLSAGDEQMDVLEKNDYILKRTNLLENRLVLITQNSESTVTDVNDLTESEIKKISIGNPETVPAGEYARQTMLSYDLWKELESKLVYASDVTQVLSHVRTGNADAGFVYQTDAGSVDDVRTVATISLEHHHSIDYPAGIVKETGNPQETDEFYRWLQGEKAKNIFSSYGFEMGE